MMRQFELVERVGTYDPQFNEALLNRAYVFSMKAHGSQKRASGDPYFSHPVEVAGILTEYKLDTATIATALLHDTVEDTVATIEEIEETFGPEVSKLVDGVTKLSKLELRSEQHSQAENFRKLVLAMSDDIRVLLVKLADRLHNMRTLHYLKKPEKRRRIAVETMEIYVPLAERLGMQQVKQELEDLSFQEINPEARASIIRRLDFLRDAGGNMVERIATALTQLLRDAGLTAEIAGREKTPLSIWRKMERTNVTFEQLSDTVAFRVIVDTIPECYQVLGIVHGRYPMVPGRFKDYISTPKRNNYRSLHTTVIGPENRRIEIQVRTRDMHDVAELGVAAHWSYKQGVKPRESSQYRWLQELVELLENAHSPEEFLEHTKLEMFQDQVFSFTPRGDVIALPRGATPVDFAYALHTDIGESCVGARVNGRMVPLRTELLNGDQVEIIRSDSLSPNPGWESFVVTGKARASIRRFVRNQQRAEHRKLGHAIAEKVFREAGQSFSEVALQTVLPTLSQRSLDDLYAGLGQGQVTSSQLSQCLFPGERRKAARNPFGAISRMLPARLRRGGNGDARPKEHSVPISGLLPGMAVHYAPCCHPLPGDRIVGILHQGRGVDIHTIDCETLTRLADNPDSWLDVRWDVDPQDQGVYVGRILAVVANEPGGLSNLSSAIASNLGNISNLKITDRSQDFFEMQVDIEVKDVRHLTDIIAALRAVPSMSSVERVRG